MKHRDKQLMFNTINYARITSYNVCYTKLLRELLHQGGVFAFGLSEKTHGADLYSSEMVLVPQADGTHLARGSKYYIGNGNCAAMVSTFGKISTTGEYVFFAVDPA